MPRDQRPHAAGGARPLDFLPILGSVAMWGLAPVLITLLGRARFDSYTQNAFRYVAAAAFWGDLATNIDSALGAIENEINPATP